MLSPVSTDIAEARRTLGTAIDAALRAGASGPDLVELLISTGWQRRPEPDPRSDFLEGVLDSGRRVPIEIRHGAPAGARP